MLYLKPNLDKMILYQLELLKEVSSVRDRISDETLMSEKRVYGGGLHKLEPRELGNSLCDPIVKFSP